MGGTSTDVALIENGLPQTRRETRVGDVMVRAPSIDVRTVGAGGGSIAYVPELTQGAARRAAVGGRRAGPAAYRKGGSAPTVTDANVVLGYLPADAEARRRHDDRPRRSRKRPSQKIADALGNGLEKAAEGIINIVNENMFGALRLVSVEQGYDPRDFALIAFGGAGPLHANALGKLIDSGRSSCRPDRAFFALTATPRRGCATRLRAPRSAVCRHCPTRSALDAG